MADDPVPVGDLSHLADELPSPRLERVDMPVQLGIREEDGSTTLPCSPVTMPGVVEHIASGQEQLTEKKMLLEACPNCKYFYFPMPDSQEYREIVATIKSKLAVLPKWQIEVLQGKDPDEWGVCRKHNGMCHRFSARECFKRGDRPVGPHLAKDRRDA